MGDGSGRRRLRAFSSLAGNTALLRVLAAYVLFTLTEYAVWIAMLVFAYRRGGIAVATTSSSTPGSFAPSAPATTSASSPPGDWGGGYGYARLATVRCTEPGRLLRLTGEDLVWLAGTEPTVKAKLAASLAERLQNR